MAYSYKPGRKCFGIVFGQPGGGKSHAVAKAMQNSLAILTGPNNIMFYEQWLRSPEGQASGRGMPRRVIVIDRYVVTDSWNPDKPFMIPGPDGLATPIPQKPMFENLLGQAVRRTLTEYATRRPLTYENIFIDEGGTLWTRIFEEISPTVRTKEGVHDPRGAFNVGASWSRAVVDFARQVTNAGANFFVVAHDREPEIDKGKLGGPAFFSQGVMRQLCADADASIYREMRDIVVPFDLTMTPDVLAASQAAAKEAPAERLFRVHASEHWLTKIRGLPDSMFAQVRKMELEDLLTLSGYAV